MSKYCPECGKEITSFASNCPNCGYPNLDKKASKSRLANASFVLSIIGCCCSLGIYTTKDLSFGGSINVYVYAMVLGVLSLIFGIVSTSKNPTKKSILGTILGIVTIVVSTAGQFIL